MDTEEKIVLSEDQGKVNGQADGSKDRWHLLSD